MIDNLNYSIRNLVPRHLFLPYQKEEWRFLTLFDNRIFLIIQELFLRYGSFVINDWFDGGSLQFNGFRDFCSPNFSIFDPHSFGRALDINFLKHPVEEIRDDLIRNDLAGRSSFIKEINENGPTLHVGLNNSPKLLVLKNKEH